MLLLWSHTVAKGCIPAATEKGTAGRWDLTRASLCLDIPVCAQPCCWERDPSPCCKPYSLSLSSEAPAFLAKPGSGRQLRNVGVMLQGTLPLQLLPAHSSVLACLREEQEESSAGQRQLCRDICLLCCPCPRQRDSACAARGQGHIKGGFTEVLSLRLCLLVLREVLAAEELLHLSSPERPRPGAKQPRTVPGLCCGKAAVPAARGKELSVAFTQSLPWGTLQTDPTSSDTC